MSRKKQIDTMVKIIERWRKLYRGIDKEWQSVVIASELYEYGFRCPDGERKDTEEGK